MTLAKNVYTYPHYDVTHRKPKLFQFFNNLNYKTSCIFSVFQQLSSSMGWRVMVVQNSARNVAHAGLKGLV